MSFDIKLALVARMQLSTEPSSSNGAPEFNSTVQKRGQAGGVGLGAGPAYEREGFAEWLPIKKMLIPLCIRAYCPCMTISQLVVESNRAIEMSAIGH